MANFNQVFKSTDASAPTITGQVNSVPTMLGKCLVDGYTTATLTSIVRKGTGNLTALALMASANATLWTGTYVTVSGCTSTGAAQYNITAAIKCASAWKPATAYTQGALVTNGGNIYVHTTASGTSAGSGGPSGTGTGITDGSCTWDYVAAGSGTAYFTYQVASDPGANASGSPVYGKAALGWTRPFAAGTNAQVFRSADTSSPQHYCQIIDNGATAGAGKEAQMYAAETMTADQTVTLNQYPSSAQAASGLCIRKSTTADGTARAWTLAGDDRTWYLWINTGDAGANSIHGGAFGYFIPYKPGDAYNSFVAGGVTFNSAASVVNGFMAASGIGGTVSAGCFCPRSYTQIGSSISVLLTAMIANAAAAVGAIGATGQAGALIPYPNPPDAGLYVSPVFITDTTTTNIRGRLPGIYAPLHTTVPLGLYDEVTGVTGLSGVTLMAVSSCSGGVLGETLVDKFGLWT